jgi:DNA-binding MurR/RpiR family transcriptional regulator
MKYGASEYMTAMETGETEQFEAARRVLELEAEAILALARSLDARFVAALDILTAVSGRVIVTGMGKSGHIAHKIAATLASTGTPSHYVHPGEASHGDLGMIVKGDAVIALSNSGNTRELNDILEYTRRFSIPLIGITAKSTSIMCPKGARWDWCQRHQPQRVLPLGMRSLSPCWNAADLGHPTFVFFIQGDKLGHRYNVCRI